jgi:hypothetical protein
MKKVVHVYCVPTGIFFVLTPGFILMVVFLTLLQLEAVSDVLPAAHALHHTGAGQTAGLRKA